MKKLILFLIGTGCSFWIWAQNETGDPAASGMRSNGKIYVVLAVVVTIVIGLLLYVISLDRKIARLEKQSS